MGRPAMEASVYAMFSLTGTSSCKCPGPVAYAVFFTTDIAPAACCCCCCCCCSSCCLHLHCEISHPQACGTADTIMCKDWTLHAGFIPCCCALLPQKLLSLMLQLLSAKVLLTPILTCKGCFSCRAWTLH